MSVGQPVDAEGPPISGSWTPITMAFVADVEQPARPGEAYPWHDAIVQQAPELFVPADAESEVIRKAIDDYHVAALSPEPHGLRTLKAGPGVVRSVHRDCQSNARRDADQGRIG
jgi:hypothetical protein